VIENRVVRACHEGAAAETYGLRKDPGKLSVCRGLSRADCHAARGDRPAIILND
jgi:hypothetical protein